MLAQSPSSQNIVLLTLAFEIGLAVLALAIGWALGNVPSRFVQWSARDAGWGLLATGPMLVLLAGCLWIPWKPLVDLRRLVSEGIRPLFGQCALWQLALIAAAAGLGEELLFRGIIQHYTVAWWGLALGLLTASLVFGLAHFLSVAYLVFATIVGAYLGWLWIQFDNLLVPIVAHGAYDFVALVYVLRWTNGPRDCGRDD